MSDYPEHDKITAHEPDIDAITFFLEWASGEQKRELCRSFNVGHQLDPDTRWTPLSEKERERMVWEFFGIDAAKIEEERKQIVNEYRRNHYGRD